MAQPDCFICKKHQALAEYTGEVITERGGLKLTHFPLVDGLLPTKGYLLIEPSRHIEDFTELSDSEASALGVLIRDATKVIKSLGAEHVYLYRINDKVAHLHFHLIPRYPGTPKEYWGTKIMEWGGAEKLKLEQVRLLSEKLRLSF